MDNSINNVSFRANLKPLTKIENKKAFIEVRQLFKEGTKQYPKDNFIISEESAYINSPDNISEELFIDNINILLNSMSPKELANKLINNFNALKFNQQEVDAITLIKAGIKRAKSLLRTNISIATACQKNGNVTMAKRYKVLAQNNEAKINSLRTELAVRTDSYNGKILDMAKQDKDLKQLIIRNII